MHRTLRLLACGALLLASLAACRNEQAVQSPRFRVELGEASAQPVSGRLLLFAVPLDAAQAGEDGRIEEVDSNLFEPTRVSVAAQEVAHLAPGASVAVDTDAMAFPAGFSQLPPGEYAVQAVLDVDRDYNYGGRGAGDLVSDVATVRLGGGELPALSLVKALPAHEPWTLSERAPQAMRDALPAARANTEAIDFTSPALSAFWGRPIAMHGWVLLPPDYAADPRRTFPTVYFTHGFGGNRNSLVAHAIVVDKAMRAGEMPPMIWVFLDESGATGTHEFADSVNNGPWGTALVTELIPALEEKYRMDATASGRFLNGHSSGGWATLWLQVTYPKVFGGTWSTSPDASDFRDFTGVDIYADGANAYRKPDGTPRPLVRADGEVKVTFEQYARLERVFGPVGGQMASFEWVFSPRGEDGRPVPLFDRDTGAVDPEVAAYWREHYDIAHRLRTQWPQLAPDLDGKIHVIVGDADTFYLDGSARLLQATLQDVGAQADVRFMPGRTHFDLYTEGDDNRALLKKIAWEMHAVARPDASPPARERAPSNAVPATN